MLIAKQDRCSKESWKIAPKNIHLSASSRFYFHMNPPNKSTFLSNPQNVARREVRTQEKKGWKITKLGSRVQRISFGIQSSAQFRFFEAWTLLYPNFLFVSAVPLINMSIFHCPYGPSPRPTDVYIEIFSSSLVGESERWKLKKASGESASLLKIIGVWRE